MDASERSGPGLALTLVVGGLGMAIVGYGLYVVTKPRARPTFEESSARDEAALPEPLGEPESAVEPEPAAAPEPTPSLPPPGSVYNPNGQVETSPEDEPFVPEPPELNELQRRSVAAFLKNDPEQVAPARLEQRARRALERLDKLPEPPLRPGGDEFMDYMGIWDEVDRMRATAAYLAGAAGREAGVDTERYAAAQAEIDGMYADGQKRWRARQRAAVH